MFPKYPVTTSLDESEMREWDSTALAVKSFHRRRFLDARKSSLPKNRYLWGKPVSWWPTTWTGMKSMIHFDGLSTWDSVAEAILLGTSLLFLRLFFLPRAHMTACHLSSMTCLIRKHCPQSHRIRRQPSRECLGGVDFRCLSQTRYASVS